jgi:hypothetical protein
MIVSRITCFYGYFDGVEMKGQTGTNREKHDHMAPTYWRGYWKYLVACFPQFPPYLQGPISVGRDWS